MGHHAFISEMSRNTSTVVFRINGVGVEDLDLGWWVLQIQPHKTFLLAVSYNPKCIIKTLKIYLIFKIVLGRQF
jgi:hypothetical protein